MKRYMIRLTGFMTAYVVTLVGGLTLAKTGLPLWGKIGLAAITAAPICGIFWAVFRMLDECDDEYQRLLMIRQILLGTAATLAVSTIWQFLQVYDVLEQGPQWIGTLWCAMLGLAAPIVRRRA
jgi:hypothetical protein